VPQAHCGNLRDSEARLVEWDFQFHNDNKQITPVGGNHTRVYLTVEFMQTCLKPTSRQCCARRWTSPHVLSVQPPGSQATDVVCSSSNRHLEQNSGTVHQCAPYPPPPPPEPCWLLTD
jgi:hypothetical protein